MVSYLFYAHNSYECDTNWTSKWKLIKATMDIRLYVFAFIQKSIHKWMGCDAVLSKPLWLNLVLILFALLSFGSWKIFD